MSKSLGRCSVEAHPPRKVIPQLIVSLLQSFSNKQKINRGTRYIDFNMSSLLPRNRKSLVPTF
jgi:hypothetical protein